MTTNSTTMPKAYSTGAHGSNEVFPGVSPTTGLAWEGTYRPIMVQFDNQTGARPHLNLSEADIVYESIVWGPGHTRYSAIYNDNHPDQVGSVRSARWHHFELREEWNAVFVFWGGQSGQSYAGTNIQDFVKNNSVPVNLLFDGVGVIKGSSSKALGRISTRVSPHNAVANLAEISTIYWPNGEDGNPFQPKTRSFKFSSIPSTSSDTAVGLSITYDPKSSPPIYNPSYTYNADLRVYERSYCGEAQYDGTTGKRIVASNVIVQFCQTEFINSAAARPLIHTQGGGVMDAFIDGKHIRGTWEKNLLTDRTIFMDMNGNELTLLPGKTFIQIVPQDMSYTYTREDTTVVTLDVGAEVDAIVVDTSGDESEMNKME